MPTYASKPRFYPASRVLLALCAGVVLPVTAATLQVGPTRLYTKPCAAIAAATAGDIVEIDAATYIGDVCGIYANNLTIRGVNGRPKIDAGGNNAMGKGTWVIIGSNVVVENVEMFGARVADRNGAALRLEGDHFTLRGSFIHDNENGVLGGLSTASNILIETTEFGYNGYGDGYSHNIYIFNVGTLTFRYNYTHDANVGHNLKSRARVNNILYNRFSSTPAGQTGSTTPGQPSYEIDLPNAGTSYVIGNVIQQPAVNQNPGMLAYGAEGASNPGQDLYVVNNTFLNDQSTSGTFILAGGTVTTPILMQNNIFGGVGTVNTQTSAIDKTNYRSMSPGFIDRGGYDLHPTDPLVRDSGSAPGLSASGVSLMPVAQYRHVASGEARPTVGQIDIGAYEAVTTSSGADTVAPLVTFVSPKNGDTVRRKFKVSVNATDNVAVARTSLYLDGKLITSVSGGTLGTTVSTTSTGAQTLTATAVDAANNQTSSSVTVMVVR